MEILLTAFITLLFSFLIAKIVSLALGGTDSVSGVEEKPTIDAAADEIIMEELEFAEKLKAQGFESEKKVEFVEECADKVEVFETEQSEVDQGFESEKEVECVQETTADNIDELELEAGVDDQVVERLEVQGFESEKEVGFLQNTADEVQNLEAEQDKVGEAEIEEKLDDIAGEIGKEFEAENETPKQSEEISVEESLIKGLGEEEKEVKLDDDDDDWEGIERSELEKVFADAAKFVENKGDLEGMGNDVQMELYGLHKIATEGPCREPQPLAFMVSSRSKWNAWQRLGNMNPDAAMEQYVALVSDKIPGWKEESSAVSPSGFQAGENRFESADPGIPGSVVPDINSNPDQKNICTQERNADLESATGGDITESTSFENQAKD